MVFVTLFMNVQPVHASTETTKEEGFKNISDFLVSYAYHYVLEQGLLTEDNTVYVESNGSRVTFYYNTYCSDTGYVYMSQDGDGYSGYIYVSDLLTAKPSVSTFKSYSSASALTRYSTFNTSYSKVEYVNYDTTFCEANMPEPLDYSQAYHKYFGGEGEVVPPSGDDEGTVEGDVNITVVDNTKIERLLNNILAILIFVVIWSMFLYPLAHKMTNNKGLM